MLTKSSFARDLATLGVESGDVLYLRASLGAAGEVEGDLYEAVVGGLLEAVGPAGTILAPAFTKIGNVFGKGKVVIDANTAPYSGAISKLLLRHPEMRRSTHPSHSFVSIGAKADFLLEGHGPESSCFQPVKKLAEIDGKMLLMGCNSESPGFSTVHVAQFDLGLSQKHLVRHLQEAWISHDGQLVRWKPIESPGCSASFDKFYPAYIRDRNLLTGYLGKAYSILIPSARKALARDTEILKDNPTFVDCGRRDCLTCGFRSYQLRRLPVTFLAAGYSRLVGSGKHLPA